MSLSSRDKVSIWHPYTQHGLHPKVHGVVRAKGSYIYDENGNRYIDAFSSWWTTIHGHSHPHIARKVSQQLKTLEHVVFAGFTHKPAVELAERLLKNLPSNQKKIFFSDNGSTAVEVALKMCLQYWYNKGVSRNKIITFKHDYHGDTFGAMSVSERDAFSNPFRKHLFRTIYINEPRKGKERKVLNAFSTLLKRNHRAIAAFIFEPLVQGVAGMIPYDANALNEMIALCKKHKILTIADEVFTGFGRTGKFFATDSLSQKPDIYCLSKGLTGGTMAMGVTSCTVAIYKAFLSTDRMKTFFHGHSFTANPVACSAALASLDLMEKKQTWQNIKSINQGHLQFRKSILSGEYSDKIANIYVTGTILSIELQSNQKTSYFDPIRDKAEKYFFERGILIRPLGNIIYVLPPYCISNGDLKYIYATIQKFIKTL